MPDPSSLDQLRQAASSLDQLHQAASECVGAIGTLWERAIYPSGESRAIALTFLDGGNRAASVDVVRNAVGELVTAGDVRTTILPSARPWLLRARAGRGAGEFVGCGVRAPTAHEAALDLSTLVLLSVWEAVMRAHRCAVSKESLALEGITEANLAQVCDALHDEWSQTLIEGIDHLRNEMLIDYTAATDLLGNAIERVRWAAGASQWSKARSRKDWAKKLGISASAFDARRKDGVFTTQKQGRLIQVALADLPAGVDP
jgi:hypothetical protein